MRNGRARRAPIGAAFLAGALCLAALAGTRAAHAAESSPIGTPEDDDALRRQRFELAGFGGIGLGGDFNQPAGRVDFEDGPSFAGLLAARVAGPFFLELSYSRRPSTLTLQPSGDAGSDPTVAVDDDIGIDIGVEYYQIGATYRWSSPVRWLTPLVGVTLGASRIDAVPESISDYWGFAWAPLAGVQFDILEYFALRPQVRFLFTDVTKGNEIFCGDQPSCEASTRSVVSFQTDVALGLVLKI